MLKTGKVHGDRWEKDLIQHKMVNHIEKEKHTHAFHRE